MTIYTTDIQTTITGGMREVAPAVVMVVGTIAGEKTFLVPTGDQTVGGSGVFISQDGYLLPNNYVVKDTQEGSMALSDGTLLSTQVGTGYHPVLYIEHLSYKRIDDMMRLDDVLL